MCRVWTISDSLLAQYVRDKEWTHISHIQWPNFGPIRPIWLYSLTENINFLAGIALEKISFRIRPWKISLKLTMLKTFDTSLNSYFKLKNQNVKSFEKKIHHMTLALIHILTHIHVFIVLLRLHKLLLCSSKCFRFSPFGSRNIDVCSHSCHCFHCNNVCYCCCFICLYEYLLWQFKCSFSSTMICSRVYKIYSTKRNKSKKDFTNTNTHLIVHVCANCCFARVFAWKKC